MRAAAIIAAVLLGALLTAAPRVEGADGESGLSVTPETVGIGLGFAGTDVIIDGTTPEGGDVVLVVDGPLDSVKMQKKGRVMGLFWMTIEQAEVEHMPAFHMVRSSEPIEHLLTREQQVSLGVDPEASNIMGQAQAVDPADESPLSEEKQTEFVTALRDRYITDGQYTPWRCYHEAEAAGCDGGAPTGAIIQPDDDGRWETAVALPSDAPLGEYSVQAHYVVDGEVVGSEAATFSVEKDGVVDSLWTMAQDKAPLYAAMSLVIAIVMGITIGFVFPRGGAH